MIMKRLITLLSRVLLLTLTLLLAACEDPPSPLYPPFPIYPTPFDALTSPPARVGPSNIESLQILQKEQVAGAWLYFYKYKSMKTRIRPIESDCLGATFITPEGIEWQLQGTHFICDYSDTDRFIAHYGTGKTVPQNGEKLYEAGYAFGLSDDEATAVRVEWVDGQSYVVNLEKPWFFLVRDEPIDVRQISWIDENGQVIGVKRWEE
jgi:hypothetical protein